MHGGRPLAFTARYSTPILAHRGRFNGGRQAPPGARRASVRGAAASLPAPLLCSFATFGQNPWPAVAKRGREPARNLLMRFGGPAPQSGEMRKRFNVDCVTLNQRVQGSSPCAPTNKIKHLL